MGFKGWKEEHAVDKMMDWLGPGTEEGGAGGVKGGVQEMTREGGGSTWRGTGVVLQTSRHHHLSFSFI